MVVVGVGVGVVVAVVVGVAVGVGVVVGVGVAVGVAVVVAVGVAVVVAVAVVMTALTAREALGRLNPGTESGPMGDAAVTLGLALAAAEDIVNNIHWHTDSHGNRMGGYEFTLDGKLLDALAAALKGET